MDSATLSGWDPSPAIVEALCNGDHSARRKRAGIEYASAYRIYPGPGGIPVMRIAPHEDRDRG